MEKAAGTSAICCGRHETTPDEPNQRFGDYEANNKAVAHCDHLEAPYGSLNTALDLGIAN